MTIKNILITSVLFVVLSINYSCNAWLDTDLINKVEENELFSTPEGFYKAMAGVYSNLGKSNLYGYELSYGTLDIMGQLYDYNRLPIELDAIKELNYLDKNFRSKIDEWWSKLYFNIESLNNILRWSEQNRSILSEREYNQIKGEALGLRSFLFFDLIRLFAPDVKINGDVKKVPYNCDFGVGLPDIHTTKEMLELILRDLYIAELCLENDPIIGVDISEMRDNKPPFRDDADQYVARMNYYAVKAIMARVYLMRGDNENARKKALEIINEGSFELSDRVQLASEGNSALKDILFSDEHIFSFRNKHIPTEANNRLIKIIDATRDVEHPLTVTYQNNYDIPTKDIRWMEWFTPSDLSVKLVKYYKHEDNSDNYFPKIPVIRLSEMYLLLAESYLEDDLEKAKSYVDIVRQARIGDDGITQSFSIEEYVREVRREFPGEGQLFFMYKRLNRAIWRDGGASSIPAEEKNFVLPIPNVEIENRGDRI